jgi:uncharacterized protein YjbJ (UPF0337 family)
MRNDREFKVRRRAMGALGNSQKFATSSIRAAAAGVGRPLRQTPAQAQRAPSALEAAADDSLTNERRTPKMRSARQDTIRGRIDKIAGRILEAFGRLTGNRSAAGKGKAARARGAGRSAMGRAKRLGH